MALNGFRGRVEVCQKVIGNLNAERVDFVLHDADYATSSLERWAYPHRSQKIQVPATMLGHALASWERVDVAKIDAEGADALVWERM